MAIYINDREDAIAADGTRKSKENYILQSTDTKPTNCGAGSICFEGDTGKWYMYDGAAWRELE